MTDPLRNQFQMLFMPAIIALFILTSAHTVDAQPVKNGFDLGNSLVPPQEIRSGGPPKDGIPALTNPTMISPGEASYLDASDQVIGVDIDGEARAYPLKILVHHENVNDVVGGQPVAVTY